MTNIPSFKPQGERTSDKTRSAVELLKNVGLLPTEAVPKKRLSNRDAELHYIKKVYFKL